MKSHSAKNAVIVIIIITIIIIIIIMYCLINEQECFIGFKTTRRSRVVLDPIKHDLRVYWTASKNDLIE